MVNHNHAMGNGPGPDPVAPVRADQAQVNVTLMGYNANLEQPVSRDATDAEIKAAVAETLIGEGLPGIGKRPNAHAELRDYVVDRVDPTKARPWHLYLIRAKTPFGFTSG